MSFLAKLSGPQSPKEDYDFLHSEGYRGLPPEVQMNVDGIVANVLEKIRLLKSMPLVGNMIKEKSCHFEREVEDKMLQGHLPVVLMEIYLRVKEELKKGTNRS